MPPSRPPRQCLMGARVRQPPRPSDPRRLEPRRRAPETTTPLAGGSTRLPLRPGCAPKSVELPEGEKGPSGGVQRYWLPGRSPSLAALGLVLGPINLAAEALAPSIHLWSSLGCGMRTRCRGCGGGALICVPVRCSDSLEDDEEYRALSPDKRNELIQRAIRVLLDGTG
jgi:hypothetical protein